MSGNGSGAAAANGKAANRRSRRKVVAPPPVADVGVFRDRLRPSARALMGFPGAAGPTPGGVTGLAPSVLVPVALLGLATQLPTVPFVLLAPEVARALGVTGGLLDGVTTAWAFGVGVGAFGLAGLVRRGRSRAHLSIACGVLTAVVLAVVAVGGSGAWSLGALLLGVASASAWTLHLPLLVDGHPPAARLQALALHRAAMAFAWAVGGGTVILLRSADLTWRSILLALAGIALVATAGALRLRDPLAGGHDEAAVRALVREESGAGVEATASGTAGDGSATTVPERLRRAMAIPTTRAAVYSLALLGFATAPLPVYADVYLDERWNIELGGRAAFFAIAGAITVGVLGVVGWLGGRLLATDPTLAVALTRRVLLAGILSMVGAVVVRMNGPMIVLLAFGVALLTAAALTTVVTVVTLLPAKLRGAVAALVAVLASPPGTRMLTDGFGRRYGAGGSILFIAFLALVGWHLLRKVGASVDDDVDRVTGGLIEDEELRVLVGRGVHLPLLRCTGIDFHYGTVQTLFDVDLTVDDGEMVALLGTNGAGKSTLLRVISGVGQPSAGTVRLAGEDITFMDTTERLRQGICAIEGGRSTFGPLTVVENLRLLGYSHGRNRAAVERGLDATFEAFPRLAERRNQPASTLSGGEQQMLALGKALIVEPRLLLIDELSLGLAPVAVQELLGMVRTIHARGTAVMLVEQSVTTALRLVDHAYFMEKGAIRFDGPAGDLLARGDLLRSVFLQGTARGLGVKA